MRKHDTTLRREAADLQQTRGKPSTLATGPRPQARAGTARKLCACDGGCPRCASASASHSELRVGNSSRLQARLVVGSEANASERVADQAAAQALSSVPQPPRIPRDPGLTDSDVSDAPESVGQALAQNGATLDEPVRREMQHRFAHDFSAVRVHRGVEAERSAKDVGARAYTVGRDIVFASGEYAPNSSAGRQLLAHELAHVAQQTGPDGDNFTGSALRRTPAAPQAGGDDVPFDRSKVQVSAIPDIDASPPPTPSAPDAGTPVASAPVISQVVTVTFAEPSIVRLAWEFYDPADAVLPGGFATAEKDANALTAPLVIQNKAPSTWVPAAGRHLVRCIGYNKGGDAVAYADRTFYLWTTKPTGKPPDIATLIAEKARLEAITKSGSGKSFGEVGAATTQLKKVTHDLAVLETGTGTYVGNQCPVAPAGTTPTDCTNIVLEVLSETFAQQGKAADWTKVKKKYAENTKARGGTGLSGLDVQAALQSEAGWKGVYWAPDPAYQIPKAELDKANPDEASFTSAIAGKKQTYYKDYGKAGYPGVSISQRVINYAPELPKDPTATASTTTKDTTQLNKLKKVPFGVLSAHGGQHMTLITYGKVIEVHWSRAATDPSLIEQTDLENWAVGPKSGYHYYASGAIVAPAADIDNAFK